MIQLEEKKVVREWDEQIHRAAQDPAVKAEAERVCRQLLMMYMARAVR